MSEPSSKFDLDLACNFTLSSFAPSVFSEEWDWNDMPKTTEQHLSNLSRDETSPESQENGQLQDQENLYSNVYLQNRHHYQQLQAKQENWLDTMDEEETNQIKKTLEELTSDDSISANSPHSGCPSPSQTGIKLENEYFPLNQSLPNNKQQTTISESNLNLKNTTIEEGNVSSEEDSTHSKKKNDKLRRERNNILERKRRDNINSRIMEVYQLLPDRDYDQKPNKSVILCKCINYIKYMQTTQTKLKEQLNMSTHHSIYLTQELSEANNKVQQLLQENAKLRSSSTPIPVSLGKETINKPDAKRRKDSTFENQIPLLAPSANVPSDLGRIVVAAGLLWFTTFSPAFSNPQSHSRTILSISEEGMTLSMILFHIFKLLLGLIMSVFVISFEFSFDKSSLHKSEEILKSAKQSFNQGEYELSLSYLEDGLSILSHPMPKSKIGLWIAISKELFKRMAFGFVPSFVSNLLTHGGRQNTREGLVEIAKLYNQYNESFMGNTRISPLLVMYITLASVNIAEILNINDLKVDSYGYLSRNALIYKDRLVRGNWISRYFRETALKISKNMSSDSKLASLIKIDGFHLSNCGNQIAACENFAKSAEIYRSNGEEEHWRECMTYQAWIKYSTGNISSFEIFKQTMRSAEVDKHSVSRWRAYIGLSANTIRHGFYTLAESFCESLSSIEEVGETEKMSFYYSFKSAIAFRNGRSDESLEFAKKSIDLFKKFEFSAVNSNEVVGLSYSIETIFGLWRKAKLNEEHEKVKKISKVAEESMDLLKKFGAEEIAFYRSKFYVYSGIYKFLLSREDHCPEATQLIEKGIAESEKLHLPFEEAIARLELARYSTSPFVRSANLRKSSEIFESCDAPFELTECYQELQFNCVLANDPIVTFF